VTTAVENCRGREHQGVGDFQALLQDLGASRLRVGPRDKVRSKGGNGSGWVVQGAVIHGRGDPLGAIIPHFATEPPSLPPPSRPDDRSATAAVHGSGSAGRHHGSPIRPSARERPDGQSGARSTSAMQVLKLWKVRPRNGGGGLRRDQVQVPPTATNWKALGPQIWNRTARPSQH
jgi:hypothetical protein